MKKAVVPIIIFIAFVGIYIGISLVRDNYYLFQPVWDVGHYLTISEDGYETFPCRDARGNLAGTVCGNVGWYPMWPLVVALVRPILGGSSPAAFMVLTYLFCLLSFIFLYRLIEKIYSAGAAVFSLLALAFGPASFYLITGFPYAFFLFLFTVYLYLLYQFSGIKRDIGLFITALAISLTYPTGILFVFIPLLWYFGRNNTEGKPSGSAMRLLTLLKYIIPFILGPLLLCAYFYFKFDDFFLLLHFQEKFDRTWAFPLWIMLKTLLNYSLLRPENVTVLWYGLIFVLFYPYKIRRELWIMALILYFFSPATGTMMSIYRHYLIIFPAYLIVGTSERPVWLKAVFIIVGLVLALTILFPKFMAYRLI